MPDVATSVKHFKTTAHWRYRCTWCDASMKVSHPKEPTALARAFRDFHARCIPRPPFIRLLCCNHPAEWHRGGGCVGNLLFCACTEMPAPPPPSSRS